MNSPSSERVAAILAVNCGSSSIKFALYPVSAKKVLAASLSGTVEGLEPGGQVVIQVCDLTSGSGTEQLSLSLPEQALGRTSESASEGASDDKFTQALLRLQTYLLAHSTGIQIVAVAHRIVHGGDRYSDSVVMNDEAMAYLQTLNSLAPLHQPHNLEGVLAFQRVYPLIPQVACFDTGFHATMPEVERTLALPKALRDSGIRRYGFHGLSYRYVSQQLMQHTVAAVGRVVMAHLGNGASICAMRRGLSQATTMGFSALDGLMMGTRCGSLDPGVVLHLCQQGWDAPRLETMMYKQSGLLGVSGISADMRRLRESEHPDARRAIDLFTHKVIRESGALTACIGGLDVLAFTGGIGEHDAMLREQVAQGLAYLGVKIDTQKNQQARGDAIAAIHTPDSTVELWVVPTDEGWIAASDAATLLS
ncbi:acetate/propionate family kinase [Undibacterium sp. SXout7W]|uniref:acetate/propionate family kinase n=1 Tax=Undibacterium sp. SXout7W TaxID=3413049 RepID=UPI003BF09949